MREIIYTNDRTIKNYSEYLGITIENFWQQVHTSVNKDLFTICEYGAIKRKFSIGIGL
jgi:hypothetical protein